MNSTFGHFGRYGRYGDQASEQVSKLVQCRPGANPGQIICSAARSGPVPVDENGMPIAQALPAVDVLPQYAGFSRRNRYGYWGRFGAAVSSSSSKSVSSSPVVASIVSSPISSVVSSPTFSTSSYTASSPTTSTSPSYSTSSAVNVPNYVSSSIPTVSSSGTVVPSTSTASTVVQSTGSGDAPYFNSSSSSMWNPGGWGPMSAEGQLQTREGEDGPGNFDEDDDYNDDDDGGGGGMDAGSDDGGDEDRFPGKRQRKRRPGRGYPANKRKRRSRRRRHSRHYSAWGAYRALYGADDPWYGSKMRYTDKPGKGGYVYRQYVNGDIAIMRAPVALTNTFWPAPVGGKGPTRQWAAITKEIGATSPTYAALAASYKGTSSAKAQASQVPASVVVSGKKNQWLDNLFAAVGSGSSADGKKIIAQAAIQHGPELANTLSEYQQERSTSPAVLQKKITKAQQKLAAAKVKGDKVKVARLTAKIKALQARLVEAQSAADSAGGTELAMPTSSFPWKYVLGGGIGLLLIGILARQMAR